MTRCLNIIHRVTSILLAGEDPDGCHGYPLNANHISSEMTSSCEWRRFAVIRATSGSSLEGTETELPVRRSDLYNPVPGVSSRPCGRDRKGEITFLFVRAVATVYLLLYSLFTLPAVRISATTSKTQMLIRLPTFQVFIFFKKSNLTFSDPFLWALIFWYCRFASLHFSLLYFNCSWSVIFFKKSISWTKSFWGIYCWQDFFTL